MWDVWWFSAQGTCAGLMSGLRRSLISPEAGGKWLCLDPMIHLIVSTLLFIACVWMAQHSLCTRKLSLHFYAY